MTGSTHRGSFEPPGPDVPKQEVTRTNSPENCSDHRAAHFESEWQETLRNLQMRICELLLKNEQLRMSLAGMTVSRQEKPCERDDKGEVVCR